MKVSDYIIRFLEEKGILDVFGIPGVGCSHFLNSMLSSQIRNHLTYHEQGAAFAACGYAQAAKRVGFAYSTAGPGGTNLVTGIANAYADSIPTIFMVGEKDLASLKGDRKLRQRASQEVDIVDVCRPITKWSYQVKDPREIRFALERAYDVASSGRPGPVLLDIPSDIQRADVDVSGLQGFQKPATDAAQDWMATIIAQLRNAEKPLLLVGNGIKQAGLEGDVLFLSKALQIPLVTTLVCFDLFIGEENNLGFIGLDGDSAANRAAHEADLIISLGARLNFKQVTNHRENFAPKAKLIRIDCDADELDYALRDETAVCADLRTLIPALRAGVEELKPADETWLRECLQYKSSSVRGSSPNPAGNALMRCISERIPENVAIAVDTGSHRRWLMSQHVMKRGQVIYQSAGLASMGYALPAAIGVCCAQRCPVICVDGDGGLMMNLQEMQVIARERLPITIMVFNNRCLGDIMEFQKRIFQGNYAATTESSGYRAADFEGIANAFHFEYAKINNQQEAKEAVLMTGNPRLIEITVETNE